MLNNDDPIHRANLIASLSASGLHAWSLNSGGGVMHVVVTLLNMSVKPPVISAQDPTLQARFEQNVNVWLHETMFYIATNSLRTTCEIGLMGQDGRTGSQVASAEWHHVNSLEEALSVFWRLWNERDKWLYDFIEGVLVV